MTCIKCLLLKNDPSVAVWFKVLIARLSALSLQIVHVLWHPLWLVWCKRQIQAEICHGNAQFTKSHQCHWLHEFFAVVLRCLKWFADAIEWYPLVPSGDCLVRNCLTFVIWVFVFVFSPKSVHTEAIVHSPGARSHQLHLSQKDASAFDYHLNCSEKHFENTFHEVKQMFSFSSKLIIYVLYKSWMGIYFFLMAICIFVVKFVLQV